ncbi:MAG: hypothetical protein ACP5OG_05535 [Candidatus Nanoarchaeia archaeon]
MKKEKIKNNRLDNEERKEVKYVLILLLIVFAVVIVFAFVNSLYNKSQEDSSLGGMLKSIGVFSDTNKFSLFGKKSPAYPIDCNPACKFCVENCGGRWTDNPSCKPTNKFDCGDGRCVYDKSECDCKGEKPQCSKCENGIWVSDTSLEKCGTGCCTTGMVCCDKNKDKNAPFMCCDPQECIGSGEDICMSASLADVQVNYCNTDPDSCKDPTPQECSVGGNTICCASESTGIICGSQSVLGKKVPSCVKNECGSNEFKCGDAENKNAVCCNKEYEECMIKKVGYVFKIYYCSKNSCSNDGEILCGDNELKVCCSKDQKCMLSPNGSPRCETK